MFAGIGVDLECATVQQQTFVVLTELWHTAARQVSGHCAALSTQGAGMLRSFDGFSAGGRWRMQRYSHDSRDTVSKFQDPYVEKMQQSLQFR
eukprot:4837089-Amphidinium_carterae.1